jgi:hypothetical protein
MRRAFLFCASMAFAIACGESATEPVSTRTPSGPPISFATSSSDDGLLSIITDKDDYSPGETVHLTGSGWESGEVLDILLADDTHDSHTWSITVGTDGTFHDSTYVVDTRDYGVTFTLTATSPSGFSLTVIFTDGRPITSVTLNGTPTTTVASGAAISANVRGQLNGNANNTLGSIGVKAYIDGTAQSTAVQLTCYDVNPNEGPNSSPSTAIAFDHTFSFNAPSPLTGTTYDIVATSYSDNLCATTMGAFPFVIEQGISVTTNQATAFSNLSSPTITYGDTPTALTGTITAGAQIPTGSVSITLNGVTRSAAINSADGTFSSSFVTGSLEVAGSPYTITYEYAGSGSFSAAPDGTGTLTVNKATPAFSNLTSPTIAYGATPTSFSGKISAGALIPSGSVSITLNGVTRSAAINSADGTFSSSFATNLLGVAGSPHSVAYQYTGDLNFNGAADGSGTLTVNKAPLTVTLVSPQAIIFGDKPDYSVTYGGFVNGETASVLGGALTFSFDGSPIDIATFIPPVGNHVLTASGLTSANYDITYLPANGATVQVSYDFRGFFTPVDNNILNVANSGQAIPLKWQLLDYAGNPVTNLSSVAVTAATLTCALGATIDLLEEYAAGASGLQNLGNGFYQFNWKTPTSYAKSCKTMKLDLGEGTARTALFQFKR